MQLEANLKITPDFEDQLKHLVLHSVKEALELQKQQVSAKEWMSLKEGAKYAGVSYNTFIKFRHLGLKVSEIDGVKRVSKKEIDSFLQNNSY